MGSEDQGWVRVMEVATLCSLPMALKAALHLHVLDILALHGGSGQDEAHFLSASQIVAHFGDYPSLAPVTSPAAASSSLDRMLRLLASHGFLLASSSLEPADSKPVATYALNSLARYLLQTSDEGSLAPFIVSLQDPIAMQPWYSLHESILDGTVPFIRVHGLDAFSYFEKDERFAHLFNHAMLGHSKLFMQELLKTYTGFKNIKSLVDVGGGIGASLSVITSKYPHIKGINFDLPHVIQSPPRYPGVEHMGGDMFASIPKGETIFMKWILHNWSDTYCLKIMENCYKSLSSKGTVIVIDSILPDKVKYDIESRYKYQMDFLMFSLTKGGKERTQEELWNISKEAGFSKLQLICNIQGCSVVEIFKGDSNSLQ